MILRLLKNGFHTPQHPCSWPQVQDCWVRNNVRDMPYILHL